MTGVACVANIGPRGRRRRLVLGAVALVAGVALAALLIATDVSRAWRLVLFIPFWGAGHGFFQARDKT